jgi:hypothetical protein
LAAQNVAVAAQDRTVLESIEQRLIAASSLPREISMPPDAGAIRVRQRIKQMIRDEQKAETAVV